MVAHKLAIVCLTYCIVILWVEINASFIKPNNVPRVGRSNEAEMPFEEDGDLMGYVIKTNKNIPRMGRRNYDSENRYDIPKLYRLPADNEMFDEGSPEQIENYYKALRALN